MNNPEWAASTLDRAVASASSTPPPEPRVKKTPKGKMRFSSARRKEHNLTKKNFGQARFMTNPRRLESPEGRLEGNIKIDEPKSETRNKEKDLDELMSIKKIVKFYQDKPQKKARRMSACGAQLRLDLSSGETMAFAR